jgi:hypothetical protein
MDSNNSGYFENVQTSPQEYSIACVKVPVRCLTDVSWEDPAFNPYKNQHFNNDGFLPGEIFIFHACAKRVTLSLIESFSMMGPSIRFARDCGYLHSGKAVY